MGQPVKLSDALVLDARLASETQQRSIAGQVEYWARLGQSVAQLQGSVRLEQLAKRSEVFSVSDALAIVETEEGRRRVQEHLDSLPFPHFRQVSGKPGLLVRTEADGTETVGRFVHREFIAVTEDVLVSESTLCR